MLFLFYLFNLPEGSSKQVHKITSVSISIFKMNKHLILLLFLCQPFLSGAQAPLRCGNELLVINEEVWLEREAKIQQWLKESEVGAGDREEYLIPVVVHVLYSKEEERISQQQILSQIAVLNEDFNAKNIDTDKIPSEFRNLKANVGFTFCLATIDPEGELSTGILYHNTSVDCIANTFDVKDINNRPKLFYSAEGGSDAWDPSRYLNIWVGNTCERFLGQTVGLDPAFPKEEGVIIDYHYFGSGCTRPPFHLGRTTTHEVGHYFGLNHIFTGSDCQGDDGIADTPQQANAYTGCPTYPQSSCGTRDMFMNFMDYVNDDCMRLFTVGQKERMVAVLETLRPGLLTYEGDCGNEDEPPVEALIHVFPNPGQQCIYVNVEREAESPITVNLFAANGQLIYQKESNGNFIQPIPIEALPMGIYFLRLEYEEGSETLRVVVAR
jgi:Pregnancy-associated plasma protein-A/Secretion system C-terminal sorting domain